LKGLEASTTEFNATIHLTLDYKNLNNFWVSSGSATEEAEEWLIYKIEGEP
jgi:hypothetical protein